MRKNSDGSSQKSSPTSSDGVVSRSARSSLRSLTNYFRVISSGASTVARSAASAASSAINRDIESHHDQVLWAGFDKLEKENGGTRRVILLAFQSGFQVWDVEDTENVHVIVSAHDGQVSFMQMLPNPITSTALDDMFYESRPLLAVCGDSSWEDTSSRESNSANPGSETVATPTNVYVYSLKTQSYVHTLKFRSTIYTVRCSSRIVAVLQAAQIHCFDATTLKKSYTIVTNSIAYGSLSVGYGPLAVGPRWIAYSGSRIANSNSAVFNGNVPDADSLGVVIIKDIISKSVVAQFKAHKSPISALCFDPSGMLLVTASTQGHNINVFRIMPTRSDANIPPYAHLFRLQRGFTNVVIQDICFTNDSKLIAVSSSRGTSHLFEINPYKEGFSPITLSAINRIRSWNISGWMGTMSGAASAAAGMVGGGSLPGTITSTFCYSDEWNSKKYYGSAAGNNSSKINLLVFAPSGLMTQYAVGVGHETAARARLDQESGAETEGKVAVEAIRRWSMIQNQSRREMEDNHGYVYGGGGASVESKSKVFPEIVSKQSVEKPNKKGMGRVEDKHQLYISEAELQMHPPSKLPLWAKLSFQELVLHGNEENSVGGGEMKIEGIQTRMIEVRTRDLVPVWGNPQSPSSQQVIKESMQSPRNTTQGDQGWGHGTETDLGSIHSKEETSRSEEKIPRKRVNKEAIAEEKNNSEDEDVN